MIKENFQEKSDYLRVTEILSPFSGLDKIPKDIVANAARRGTKVHEICEGIIKGLGEWDVDDETKPYVDSFKEWWQDGKEVIEVERRFWDDELCITGQVDLILRVDGKITIVDLKTSYKPSKTWPIQGSAYAMLAQNAGIEVTAIQFIHLKRDGSPAEVHHYEIDFDLFKKCYDVYQYFYGKSNATKRKVA